MTRKEQRKQNSAVVKRVMLIHGSRRWNTPSYKLVGSILNTEGYTTTRGNLWTPHRLFRMLQRRRISGLYGIHQKQKALAANAA